MRVLITGPDGFVGSTLCAALLKQGFAVRGAQWQAAPLPAGCESVVVGDIGANTNWSTALAGVDAVVHLAARVHVMKDTATDPLAAFRAVNVDGTRKLAEAAAQTGVRRFILMSTIKVNGEETSGAKQIPEMAGAAPAAFSEENTPAPQDEYGISKWEAECVLQETGGDMETVVLRAPLIYGPGVKGNMLRLMKLAATGLPLPLGAVHNRRSLLYVGNLADFISRCIDTPVAANETFLISDNHDLSTSELLRMIRLAMGKAPRLIPLPAAWLKLAGRLTGKKAVVDRLFGSLQVNCSKAQRIMGWTPPYHVEEGVAEMVQDFYARNE